MLPSDNSYDAYSSTLISEIKKNDLNIYDFLFPSAACLRLHSSILVEINVRKYDAWKIFSHKNMNSHDNKVSLRYNAKLYTTVIDHSYYSCP